MPVHYSPLVVHDFLAFHGSAPGVPCRTQYAENEMRAAKFRAEAEALKSEISGLMVGPGSLAC